MRVARNVLIIVALAAAVAFLPGGSNGATVVLTLLTLAFLAAIVWFVYTLRRQNEMTLTALSDGRRAVLYGAIGLICLLVAGTDKFFGTPAGLLAWIVLLGVSIAAIWRIWLEANTY